MAEGSDVTVRRVKPNSKKAEEAARVKHNVSVGQYDLKTKAKRELKKASQKAAVGKA